MGARNASLGGASVTLTDQWSLFNNVAGLGQLDADYAFGSYQNRFNLVELQTIGGGYVRRLNATGVGVGFYRFGDELFSEQRLHLGIGHQLDQVSLGLSAGYLQYNVSSVGTVGAFVLEFGGIASLTEELSFGAHIFNVNQGSLNSQEGDKVPTVMKAGVSYQPIDALVLILETEKEIDFDEVIRVGLEYMIIDGLFLRTGISTAPFNGNFGFGFHPRNFQIDYSFSNDTFLGAIHEVSFSYQIPKK